MVTVAFKAGEREVIKCEELWQYNYGQILRIQGLALPPAVEIHFSLQETGGTSITRIGIAKDGVTEVPIPDSMLENEDITNDYSIYAFVYLTDETSGQTEYKITLKIKARPKPEIPGGGDEPDIFHEAVEAVREAMRAAAESERQAEGWAHGREDLPERAEDNAMYYAGKTAKDAEQTATDRKEVKRLVESVSGIGEQVEKVEGLTKQTQTSATNAALSEQKSEEAATRAETAQAGAETAEGNAELAAQKTGQDKTAVEQAKKLVQQMGQEILDNKNAVDKTVQDFGITAQQALADVNNAGQAQTERVQTAGNDAVESVKTAQSTATRAVETERTEAIKAVQTEGATQAGNVSAEGEKQVQAVQGAAQEIIADREQIHANKEGVAKLKEDINGLDNVLDKKKDFPQQEIIVNMINPTHFISGSLSTDGISNEIPSALFFVTDYIKVEAGKTYAMTYFNTNFKTRYFLVPNRLVFYNSSKTFVSQATDIADLEEFKTERVNISGNTSYTKLATKQSGYIRMQFGKNLQQVMMAEGEKIEWTDIYDEADVPTVPFRYVLKNEIISEVNLTTELKKKIEAGVSKAIDDIYKLAFCKIHKNVLCIGDSLTEGYHNPDDIRVNMSYPSHMESLAGYNVTNKGQSGITALGWWNAYKDKVDFTEFDAVFIYLGTNGGLTDTIDADTISGNFETFAQTNTGGYCAIIAKIKSVNPKCKIYMIQYNNITATSQVTAKIAKKYDCVTLFVTDDSVFNLTDSKFHTDVTHYNTIGYWAFACVMLVQLEKYIEEHISEYVDLVGIGEIYRP